MASAVAAERRLEVAEFRELNRIGVNLKQMARVLNFRGGAGDRARGGRGLSKRHGRVGGTG